MFLRVSSRVLKNSFETTRGAHCLSAACTMKSNLLNAFVLVVALAAIVEVPVARGFLLRSGMAAVRWSHRGLLIF